MNSVPLNITEESGLLLFFELFHNDCTSLIFVLIIPIFLHAGLNDNFSQKYKFIKILTLLCICRPI